MAQGKALRFPGKHLETIRGIPIIERTVNIIREYTDQVVVVAPDRTPFRQLKAALYTQESPGEGLLDGIFNTRQLWAQGALILLGDVVYSRQLLHVMLTENRRLTMFGRREPNPYTGREHAERYGLNIPPESVWFVLSKLQAVRWRQHRQGRLQGLYHRLVPNCWWFECCDWTDDIDLPSDLEAMRKHCENVRDF